MAYTNVWDEGLPTGAEAANTIDDIFRSLKLDIDQRIIDVFAMPSFVTDPLRPYGLKFTDVQDAVINLGDNSGPSRSLIWKDKTGATTYATLSSIIFSTTVPHTITTASANALAVGLAGATNPAFKVDASTALSATGLQIKSAAAAGGLALAVISSGADENLTINAKGAGTVSINATGTGGITLGRATTVTTGGIAVTGNSTITGSLHVTTTSALDGVITCGAGLLINGAGAFAAGSVDKDTTDGLRISLIGGLTNDLNIYRPASATSILRVPNGTSNVVLNGALSGITTLAIGGAFTGATTIAASTSITVTSASAAALTVGLNGAANPAFAIDSSTALQVAGFKITGAATGGTVALVVTDSGANASLTFNAKGSGTIGIGNVSTGAVTITPNTTISGSATFNGGATVASGQTLTVTSATITGLTAASVGTGTFPTGTYAFTGATSLTGGTTLAINAGATSAISIGNISTGQISIGRGSITQPILSGSVTSLGTVQTGNPTAAQLLTGIVAQTSTTGAGTVNLPVGASISTAITGATTGDRFSCMYLNGGAFTLTITGTAGMSVQGNAAIPGLKSAQIEFVCTGVNTWTCVVLVGA